MIYDADELKTEWSHKKQWVYQFFPFVIYGENVFFYSTCLSHAQPTIR